ncbi:FtsX-like permease family protein [Catenuloplanes indicus]|uniref:ABC transport system permease protein n=1 Tax=Catenuloplanes indicus TaxID=137267 RepID=A0AAE3VVQ9_9ACTN|nr:ABC transporter permease [Catenuloplanes indicus]MDQ0364631.1 putative ABC transport system permease protein [Catenuloplanes indicus]
MLYLAARMARHRVAGLIAVACATLGGAALVSAVGVVAESGLRGHPSPGRLAPADVVVSAPQTYSVPEDLPITLPDRAGVPSALVARLAALPGVTAAIPDVTVRTALIAPDGTVTPVDGHNWSSLPLTAPATGALPEPDAAASPTPAASPGTGTPPGTEGGGRPTGIPDGLAAPAGDTEVALDAATAHAAGVTTGGTVRLSADGRTGDYRVTAVRDTGGPAVYFDDATAIALTGRAEDRVDLVALRTEPGRAAEVADAARALDPGLAVTTGNARGDIADPETAAGRGMLPVVAGSLSGVTLLVIGIIVGGALAVSLAGQRRELALLRAVGATPRQIRRLATRQALIVTVAAAAPGAALGYLIAARFRELLVAVGLAPAALPLQWSPIPGVASVLLMLLTAWLAALTAVAKISRMPATEAVAGSRTEPRTPSVWRFSAGLVVLAGANALAVTPLVSRTEIGAGMTAMAGILAAIGLAMAGPGLLSRAGRAMARLLPARAAAPTWLAVANTRGYAVRTAAAVSTLAVAVVFTLTYAFSHTTVLAGATRDQADGTVAQLAVTAPELGRVPSELTGAVSAVPGVTGAAMVGGTTVLWTSRMFGDEVVEPSEAAVLTPEAASVLDLGVRDGDLSGLTGATVAIDTTTAASRRAGVGSEVTLVLGDGTPVTALVAAVYERGLGFGPVVLAHDLAAGHSSGLDQRLLVRTDGRPATEAAVAELVASRPGTALGPATPEPEGVPAQLWLNIAVLGVLLGYLLLGIANKLVAATSARRDELTLLRLTGAAPAQVRAMLRREATLIWAFATAGGIGLAVVPLMLLSLGFLHRPWPAGPWWLAPAVVAVVGLIAFLSVEIPGRRVLRATSVTV